MIIVIMGVTGVGKSTIGAELALRLGYDFEDADTYHSPENIRKISAGIPLTDEDRWPWLDRLHELLRNAESRKRNLVLACSALKQIYRDQLSQGIPVVWVYLKAAPDNIRKRLETRHGHFAAANLLTSQLATLEPPPNVITADADRREDEVVGEILAALPAR